MEVEVSPAAGLLVPHQRLHRGLEVVLPPPPPGRGLGVRVLQQVGEDGRTPGEERVEVDGQDGGDGGVLQPELPAPSPGLGLNQRLLKSQPDSAAVLSSRHSSLRRCGSSPASRASRTSSR